MIKSIPFYSDLLSEGTTNEVLLYGLVEALSFNEGYCWANSETMAERLGVTTGTVKNLLSSIAKKGWVEVNSVGNKRLSIKPTLGISKPKKKAKKPVEKVGKTNKRASFYNDASVTPELRKRHSTMTQATGVETGVGDNIELTYRKEIKEKNESSQSGSTLNVDPPASPFKQRLNEMVERYKREAEDQPEPDKEAIAKVRRELAEKGIINR